MCIVRPPNYHMVDQPIHHLETFPNVCGNRLCFPSSEPFGQIDVFSCAIQRGRADRPDAGEKEDVLSPSSATVDRNIPVARGGGSRPPISQGR